MKHLFIAFAILLSSQSFAKDFFVPLRLEPFELRWMNATEGDGVFRSSDYPNKIFIIEAYFQRCPDCNNNVPNIERLEEHYADNDRVQILDIGRDCRSSDYRAWIERHNPQHPVLRDCDTEVIGTLGTRAYPTTYVMNCQLEVQMKLIEHWPADGFEQVVASVDRLLENDCEK